MVNGLHLYSSLSSQQIPKRFTLQSVIHLFVHTVTVVSYIEDTAALGQTDRSGVGIQLAPSSAGHQQARQVKCLCPRTQLRQTELEFEPTTHQLQDKPLPPVATIARTLIYKKTLRTYQKICMLR
ncbi:hypothetical protein XENORESO_006348 [Xenotaenia resolanae]|uniref:Uncharacterized protein n=1 Tax=Xenotaenia resolanae TaxID=208358 RepID=A0ABV0W3W7_9TELE